MLYLFWKLILIWYKWYMYLGTTDLHRFYSFKHSQDSFLKCLWSLTATGTLRVTSEVLTSYSALSLLLSSHWVVYHSSNVLSSRLPCPVLNNLSLRLGNRQQPSDLPTAVTHFLRNKRYSFFWRNRLYEADYRRVCHKEQMW